MGLREYYCDGGCLVGKGIGAYSYLLVYEDKLQFLHSFPITGEKLTNNQAEYIAIITTIYNAEGNCTIYSDSEIVVKQLNGEYAIKDPELKKLHTFTKNLITESKFTIKFVNVPRENKYIAVCDKLNKITMGLI